MMKTHCLLWIALSLVSSAVAEVRSGSYDMESIRDASTLETKVIQDWKPAPRESAVRQKLIEITVCEWWPGQKVRLPVTLNAPADGRICRNVIIANMGLGSKPALPGGSMLRLLKEDGVGVVLIGMGTIDAMPPIGKLHLGMKEHLLATKDARYTPSWIWGISDMRALTAAVAERDVFQPVKVLSTGGSKRGVGAAAAGIADKRFTAIMPVVAPPLGNPGGPYVIGSGDPTIPRLNEQFLADLATGKVPSLPDTAHKALVEREERRAEERITLQQARTAGWSHSEIGGINSRAWDVSRVTAFLPTIRKRGLEVFYNVGANDSVSPALLEAGRRFPELPLYIVPGGQHGGPKGAGFTKQVPSQPEVEENLLAFARHHFFNTRRMIAAPVIKHHWNPKQHTLEVTVTFSDGTEPQKNELWWSVDRHQPYTLAFEFDEWRSMPLKKSGPAAFTGSIQLQAARSTVQFLSTHSHATNNLTLTVSSPLQQIELK